MQQQQQQESPAAPTLLPLPPLPVPGLCGLALGGGWGEEEEGHLRLANQSETELGNNTLRCWLNFLSRETSAELGGEGWSLGLRVAVALVYSLVCVLGLVGNLLALYLLRSRHLRRSPHRRSPLTCFLAGLALTDLQFVLTLPFWAVDTALDFRWPFGCAMCKILSSVSTFNMYASVFFLTAMSVARYCSVACSNRPARCLLPTPCPCSSSSSYPLAPSAPCWASLGVWALSLAATLPHAIYSTTVRLSERDELCLVRFPDSGGGWDPQLLLGLYQTQKVLLGFVIPLVIISVCYLLLLRFVRRRRGGGRVEEGAGKRDKGHGGRSRQSKRRSKVTRSVAIVVLAFFLCWLPNQALTLWGVLIKFDLLPFSKAFYNAQAYAFPLSVCLAHANSCLNPVLYCLVRPEFRSGLKQLLLRAKPPRSTLVILRPRKQKVAPPPAHSEPPPCPAPPAVALDGRD